MTLDYADSLTTVEQAVGGATLLTARGTLDSFTYRKLRDKIIKAALDEPTAVLIDVVQLTVPAESAWAVFTSARWHVNRWPEVPILLVSADPAHRAAIVRNSVARYVPVFSTVESAVDAICAERAPRYRRRARAELPIGAPGLTRSRELVSEWLTAWSHADYIPVAKVIVTTFVENVLQHTDSPARVRLETNGTAVTIAVEDASPLPPAIRESGKPTAPPSGLRIVGALCRRWGSAPTSTGKTVWAVIGPENKM